MFGSNRRYVSQPVYVEWVVYSTNTSAPLAGTPVEDDVRRIVREELADLVPVDVPDAPPEDFR